MIRKDIKNAIVSKSQTLIATHSHCSLSDKPGSFRPYEQFTLEKVKGSLESFLKGLCVEGESLDLYWMSIGPDDSQSLFPTGTIFCAAIPGNNEGVMMSVFVREQSGTIQHLFTAKFFESIKVVGLIAAKTSEAFDEAFGYHGELDVAEIHSQS